MTAKMLHCTLPLLLLLLRLLAGVTSARLSPAPAPAPAPATGVGDSSEFIRTRCKSTLYSDLCFTSLVGYAGSVNSDPILLAVAASNVSLARILAARANVTALPKTTNDGRTAAALHDCRSTLGDAADGTRQSVAELRLLEAEADADEVRWRVSNAQTWMSAALTNEETCTDGFGEAGDDDGEVRAYVEGCVGRLKEYTSNALALVNQLVDI